MSSNETPLATLLRLAMANAARGKWKKADYRVVRRLLRELRLTPSERKECEIAMELRHPDGTLYPFFGKDLGV